MLNTNDIQSKYNDLYVQMRKYIWDYRSVELLAELEVAVYERIPDMNEVRKCFKALQIETHDIYAQDDEFRKSFDDFESLINESDQVYSKLEVMREVLV